MTRGFSTLEILIALAVIMSSFTAVILLTSAQSLSSDSQIASEALGSARKALETQQALARKDFKLVVATTTPSGVAGINSTTAITVSQPSTFIKKVTATVSWTGTYGRNQSVSLSSFVTDFNDATGGDTCSTVLTDSSGAHGNWKSPSAANFTLATVVGDSNAANTYPISGIDAYQKRLYVTTSAGSAAFGTKDPQSGADSNAVGTLTWSNSSRVTAKDNNNATVTTSGTNVSHYLKATNFGFTIPPGSTILGIKVDVWRSANGSSGNNSVIDNQVSLVRADGTIGSKNAALSSSNTWGTSQFDASYGSATDYWNETNWTPAGVNSSNFGVVLSVKGNSTSANRQALVDSIQVTVYYTKEFYILSLANPGSPTFLGGLSTSTLQAGLNAVVVATTSTSHYAYVATNSTASQLQVIDVKNPSAPFVVATYSLPGVSKAANSIAYANGYVYLGTFATGAGVGREFHIIDVSTPPSPAEVGVWPDPANPPGAPYTSFNNDINAIAIKDGYAYLATPFSPELIALNINNPQSPTAVGSYDAPDTTGNGKSLYTVGDTIFFGRTVTGSNPEYYILNGVNPANLQANNPAPTTKDIGSSILGLVVRDSLAFLLTTKQGTNPGQLQIINATSTAQYASPVALPGGATASGVAMDCEGNYLYAASVDGSTKGYITTITGN